MRERLQVDSNDNKLKKLNLFQALQLLLKKDRKTRDSTQDTINYKRMYSNGICEVTDNKYSKMVRFSDISYQLSQDEIKQTIFAHYSTLLNSFDNSVKIQLNFINYRMMTERDYDEIVTTIQENTDISLEQYELLRKEYLAFLQEQQEKGSNGIIRDKYLVFSVYDKSYESANRRLNSIESTIKTNFQVMGVHCDEVTGVERLSIINYLLNEGTKNYIDVSEIETKDFNKLPTKD